ncbi:MAG: hydroxyacid dehydrogenase [Homoserinimonas sp.]
MNVVILEPIHSSGVAALANSCRVHQLTGQDDPRLTEVMATADALIVRSTRIGADLIELGPRLKVIGRHGAGTDNIDLQVTKDRGITVVNTPRSNTDSVAEYVITVALMMLKRIPSVSEQLRSGAFDPSRGSLPGQVDRAGLSGRDANGCRLGIIGAGAIGRAVASRAQALGMTVVAYDPYITTLDGIELVAELPDLLRQADIVSLHVPGGNGHLIDAEQLSLMQQGAMLVNAARGDLVDPIALAAALSSGHIAAAAVDVWEPEPPALDHPLLAAPNLIATPHMAAMTHEALRRMSEDVAANVIRALTDH